MLAKTSLLRAARGVVIEGCTPSSYHLGWLRQSLLAVTGASWDLQVRTSGC